MEVVRAKVFMNGGSQAVRLPKQFRFDVDEVEIIKRKDGFLLRPAKKESEWAFLDEIVGTLSDDFISGEWLKEAKALEGRELEEEFPRMEFDESAEHYEKRVKAYEDHQKPKNRFEPQKQDFTEGISYGK